CGVPELKRLFGPDASSKFAQDLRLLPAEVVVRDKVQPRASVPNSSTQVELTDRREVHALNEQVADEADTSRSSPSRTPDSEDDAAELARQIEAACRLRGFRIEPIDSGLIVAGPTLVNVPVVLQPGEAIKPIEAALADIAREVGVRTISVE